MMTRLNTLERQAIRRFRHDERGSPAVEFALIAPIFILMIFVIVQMGFAFFTYNDMFNGAREGARRMSVGVPKLAAELLAKDSMALNRNYNVEGVLGSDEVKMTITLKLSEAMIVSVLWVPDVNLTASATMRKEY